MAELPVHQLISVKQALALLDAVPVRPRVVRRALQEAHGLCLAGALLADRDYPPFDKAVMDGYAIKSADAAKFGAELRVVERIAAGQQATRPLQRGEAMAIMTGAPIPAGADAVLPVEQTKLLGGANFQQFGPGPATTAAAKPSDAPAASDAPPASEPSHSAPSHFAGTHSATDPASDHAPITGAPVVRCLHTPRNGASIAKRGMEARRGDVVLAAGQRLGPTQIAVAASIGAAAVDVCERPRVAILSTGDEIIPPSATPGPTQIRNSNTAMLIGLLGRLGCDVKDLGHAIDHPDVIRAAIDHASGFDVLFITGGMSVGQFDFTPRLLEESGYTLKITKLKIKPGKPFVFGLREPAAGRAAGHADGDAEDVGVDVDDEAVDGEGSGDEEGKGARLEQDARFNPDARVDQDAQPDRGRDEFARDPGPPAADARFATQVPPPHAPAPATAGAGERGAGEHGAAGHGAGEHGAGEHSAAGHCAAGHGAAAHGAGQLNTDAARGRAPAGAGEIAGASEPAGGVATPFVFGLPGNPVSAYVCTLRLAARLVRRIAGASDDERWLCVPLVESLPPGGMRETYQPAHLDAQGRVRVLAGHGSADVFTLAQANVLVLREENDGPRAAGELVCCLEIP